MRKDRTEKVLGAAIVMLALTSWTEPHKKEPGMSFRRALRSVPLELLDELERRGFIRSTLNSSKVQVTDEGYKRGLALAEVDDE